MKTPASEFESVGRVAECSAADYSPDCSFFVRFGSAIRWHIERPADATERVAGAAPHDIVAWLVRAVPRRDAHLLRRQLLPDDTGLSLPEKPKIHNELDAGPSSLQLHPRISLRKSTMKQHP